MNHEHQETTSMQTRRHFLQAAQATALGLAATATGAFAQGFPSRPVRVITPFPAGSGPDAALRQVAEQLSRRWGQPVLVDNKPGGNGFIAVSAFKQAGGDGHDLLQLDNTHCTTYPSTYAKLPYDVQKDFAPLRMILHTPFFVAVAKDSPYKTLDDIVNAARAQPGKVTYGSWSNGSPGHLGALQLQALKNVQMLHVPFRDFGQLYTAVASKEVDWALASIGSGGALEQAGRLRFIVVAAAQREPAYPTVPATPESASTRGFEVSGWTGLFGPATLGAPLREKISAGIRDALSTPEVTRSYKTLAYAAPDLDPKAFSELIQRETASWASIIRTAGIRLD
jgi:tripartite-type tricarboxylate transporter receptor subunit TctC